MSYTLTLFEQDGNVGLPITTIRKYLRVDYIDDDGLIQIMLDAAQALLVEYLNASLVSSSIELNFDGDELYMPYQDVSVIDKVQDSDGNDIDYTYNKSTGKLSIDNKDYEGVTFVVYHTLPAEFMSNAYNAILLQIIARMYENRTFTVDLSTIEGIDRLKNFTLW